MNAKDKSEIKKKKNTILIIELLPKLKTTNANKGQIEFTGFCRTVLPIGYRSKFYYLNAMVNKCLVDNSEVF